MTDTELITRLFPTEGIHACEEVGKVCLPVDMNKIASSHEVTLRMERVRIRYGSRTILKDLDWEIKNGEKWALFGPNGAGKSTLLSLVYADICLIEREVPEKVFGISRSVSDMYRRRCTYIIKRMFLP